MTAARPILVLSVLVLLAACGGEAPAEDGRAASGDVLEGTISDAMLPVDRVRSEAPLEDPEAFAEARSKAARTEVSEEAAEDDEAPGAEETGDAAPEAAPEAAGD